LFKEEIKVSVELYIANGLRLSDTKQIEIRATVVSVQILSTELN